MNSKQSSSAVFDRGVACYQAGRLVDAASCFKRVLKANPAHVHANHLLGLVRARQGRWDEALTLIETSVRLAPSDLDLVMNYACALQTAGRSSEALNCLDRVLARQPRNAVAWLNKGAAENDLKRYEACLASCDTAISIEPQLFEAWNNRGNALLRLRRPEDALACFDRTLATQSDLAEAWNNRGNALVELKRFAEALTSYDKALSSKPMYAEALTHRGNVLIALNRAAEALASYQRAIAIKPDYAEAYANLGIAHTKLDRLDEAAACFRRAQKLAAGNGFVTGYLVMTMCRICDWTGFAGEADRLARQCVRPDSEAEPGPVLFVSDDPGLQFSAARSYVRNKIGSPAPAPARRAPRDRSRLNIGYLSADFRQHPVASLIARLIELHDRGAFAVHGFSSSASDGSALRGRIQAAFDHCHDVENLSDNALATYLREQNIDILIDLGGHTENGRIAALSSHPVPVQVSYLGHPGTSGASFIDYTLVDRHVAPLGSAEHFSEKLVVLPDCFLPCDDTLAISDRAMTRGECGLPEAAFVLCCFNAPNKITPSAFDVWMRLLHQIPGSALWLAGSSELVKRNLQAAARGRGVDPDRLIFAVRLHSHADHLARHRLADLFLDTWPYNAHTTASEALWAGLPVLTCAGRSLASRVAGSLLTTIGLPDLVTQSSEEYEALALRLARDRDLLNSMRTRLITNRSTTPLFDMHRYRRHIEIAYREMWSIFERCEPPRSFRVAAID